MQIDIFCQVIDNYGDIGVCWRLAQQLSHKKPILKIRLFVDDLSAFNRIEPQIHPHLNQQQVANITVYKWSEAETVISQPAAMVIEAFGCELPSAYIDKMPNHTALWLNLEYLSAEDWVADLHGMPSPQPNGMTKHFFFPGFNTKTGGLLRPIVTQQPKADAAFWSRLGVIQPNTEATAFVFSYPNAPLETLYEALALDSASWTVLLAATVPIPQKPFSRQNKSLSIQTLPYLSQADFDILLDYADLNVVRGEDSFVRALWAAKPFIWQPYVQTEQTHLTKLNAWLTQTPFDEKIQQVMRAWSQGSLQVSELQQLLQQRKNWQQLCATYALSLAQHSDLATQLLEFFANAAKSAKIAP